MLDITMYAYWCIITICDHERWNIACCVLIKRALWTSLSYTQGPLIDYLYTLTNRLLSLWPMTIVTSWRVRAASPRLDSEVIFVIFMIITSWYMYFISWRSAKLISLCLICRLLVLYTETYTILSRSDDLCLNYITWYAWKGLKLFSGSLLPMLSSDPDGTRAQSKVSGVIGWRHTKSVDVMAVTSRKKQDRWVTPATCTISCIME